MSRPIQLAEWLEVNTPLGRGYAIIFESDNDENFWTVALSNGGVVTFKQKEIRLARNYTWGRNFPLEEMKKILDVE